MVDICFRGSQHPLTVTVLLRRFIQLLRQLRRKCISNSKFLHIFCIFPVGLKLHRLSFFPGFSSQVFTCTKHPAVEKVTGLLVLGVKVAVVFRAGVYSMYHQYCKINFYWNAVLWRYNHTVTFLENSVV